MRTLAFSVLGEPRAQGSKRAFVHKATHTAVMVEAGGEALRTWRQDIAGQVRAELNGDGPIEGPVKLTAFFFVRQPKKPRWNLPATRPDADKLLRALADGLQAGGALRDDAQIVTLSVRKRYGEPARVDVFLSEEVG